MELDELIGSQWHLSSLSLFSALFGARKNLLYSRFYIKYRNYIY